MAPTTSNESESDPGLLKKHSIHQEYRTTEFTYPSIRTFYHPHPQSEKLPTRPTPLPLLVFIHGLGGSVAQFSPLLTSLINAAPCVAIDFPGCGLSAFKPEATEAYTTGALASLVAEAVKQHRDIGKSQKVILIGHSLGCSIGALLASSRSPLYSGIGKEIIGLIAICPRAEPLTEQQISRLGYVRYIPPLLFDAFRAFDRYGGLESASVTRYVGRDADQETKRLQLRFNEQSKSAVFLKMLSGLKPQQSTSSQYAGLPGQDIWSGIKVPIFGIAGDDDHVSPASNVELIAQWLGDHSFSKVESKDMHSGLPLAAGSAPLAEASGNDHNEERGQQVVPDMKSTEGSKKVIGSPSFVFKVAVLPKPASHGLLYATSTVRVVSGLIQSFLATQIDHRLSLGWQLQHLTTEGKWDVKNLEKWQKIDPVSEPIADIFRAMKTLREVDEIHTPTVFVQNWAANTKVPGRRHGIRMVIDISHECPVYDPKGLEDGGIEYHKFPTVSKLPPTTDEVRAFIALVDNLIERKSKEAHGDDWTIGVHCHYGFNRTGFFIVSYLVERKGYKLQDALDLFAQKRAPGIRHEHFVNELFVRYSVGLQRRPTVHE